MLFHSPFSQPHTVCQMLWLCYFKNLSFTCHCYFVFLFIHLHIFLFILLFVCPCPFHSHARLPNAMVLLFFYVFFFYLPLLACSLPSFQDLLILSAFSTSQFICSNLSGAVIARFFFYIILTDLFLLLSFNTYLSAHPSIFCIFIHLSSSY